MDLHQITIGIGLSLLFFLIGNSFGKTVDDETLEIFFPERFDK
jgi:sodium/pantothenate symporter